MSIIYTFSGPDGTQVRFPSENLDSARKQASGLFDGLKFHFVDSEVVPGWDAFYEKYDPRSMLEHEEDNLAGIYGIEPDETYRVEGFHDMAKEGHVWTATTDQDGLQWLTPGYLMTGRDFFIVTKNRHINAKQYLFHA